MKLKIRDFLKMEVDCDVADDYDERTYIAFCGPLALTTYGKRHFRPILDNEVDYDPDNWVNGIHAENEKEAELICELFVGGAGFISSERWEKLFDEEKCG